MSEPSASKRRAPTRVGGLQLHLQLDRRTCGFPEFDRTDCLQEDGLRRDLQIWSSGLFPFFQFAATSVRPALITIYETFYLPLGDDLRPAAKAFLLALLPGLEEETGDFFDRVSVRRFER